MNDWNSLANESMSQGEELARKADDGSQNVSPEEKEAGNQSDGSKNSLVTESDSDIDITKDPIAEHENEEEEEQKKLLDNSAQGSQASSKRSKTNKSPKKSNKNHVEKSFVESQLSDHFSNASKKSSTTGKNGFHRSSTRTKNINAGNSHLEGHKNSKNENDDVIDKSDEGEDQGYDSGDELENLKRSIHEAYSPTISRRSGRSKRAGADTTPADKSGNASMMVDTGDYEGGYRAPGDDDGVQESVAHDQLDNEKSQNIDRPEHGSNSSFKRGSQKTSSKVSFSNKLLKVGTPNRSRASLMEDSEIRSMINRPIGTNDSELSFKEGKVGGADSSGSPHSDDEEFDSQIEESVALHDDDVSDQTRNRLHVASDTMKELLAKFEQIDDINLKEPENLKPGTKRRNAHWIHSKINSSFRRTVFIYYALSYSIEQLHEYFWNFYGEFDLDDNSMMDKEELQTCLEYLADEKRIGKRKMEKAFEVMADKSGEPGKLKQKRKLAFLREGHIEGQIFDQEVINQIFNFLKAYTDPEEEDPAERVAFVEFGNFLPYLMVFFFEIQAGKILRRRQNYLAMLGWSDQENDFDPNLNGIYQRFLSIGITAETADHKIITYRMIEEVVLGFRAQYSETLGYEQVELVLREVRRRMLVDPITKIEQRKESLNDIIQWLTLKICLQCVWYQQIRKNNYSKTTFIEEDIHWHGAVHCHRFTEENMTQGLAKVFKNKLREHFSEEELEEKGLRGRFLRSSQVKDLLYQFTSEFVPQISKELTDYIVDFYTTEEGDVSLYQLTDSAFSELIEIAYETIDVYLYNLLRLEGEPTKYSRFVPKNSMRTGATASDLGSLFSRKSQKRASASTRRNPTFKPISSLTPAEKERKKIEVFTKFDALLRRHYEAIEEASEAEKFTDSRRKSSRGGSMLNSRNIPEVMTPSSNTLKQGGPHIQLQNAPSMSKLRGGDNTKRSNERSGQGSSFRQHSRGGDRTPVGFRGTGKFSSDDRGPAKRSDLQMYFAKCSAEDPNFLTLRTASETTKRREENCGCEIF